MRDSIKNHAIATAALGTLLALGACAPEAEKLAGERVSVFNRAANEGAAASRAITLEKPRLAILWSGDSGNSANNTGHVQGRQNMEPLFSADFARAPDKSFVLYPPAADESALYAVDGNIDIAKISLADGKKQWVQTGLSSDASLKFGALALDDDALYAAASNMEIAKIGKESGRILWRRKLKGTLKSGLQACGGKIVLSNDAGEVFAVSAEDGQKIWSHKTLESPFGFIKGSTPACAGDKVIAALGNGEVHILSLADGSPLHMAGMFRGAPTSINSISDIVANPVAADGVVLVKSYSGGTKAISLASGEELWSRAWSGPATPAASNGFVFDVDGDGIARAFDLASGAEVWSLKPDLGKGAVYSPLLINNRLVIAGASGAGAVIDPYEGRILERVNFGMRIDAPPMMAGEKLVISGAAGLRAWR
ncbi:MAG: PQQ-binding-like beta-propeller repeat protein [Rickettsiales bacterium]|nr:PQQ-binding-like beta-propeller repeat protein [Rickettsiales bacterium]